MKTSNNEFISFRYDNRQQPTKTTCIIRDSQKNVVAEATVTRYHKDSCDKDKARRFAITKALKNNSSFGKADRQRIWSSYLTR